MVNKKLTLILGLFLLVNVSVAQEIKNSEFPFQIIGENFIKKQDNFPIVRENDNYFIIDENDYLIIRENVQSDYVIILDGSLAKNTLLKTSVKMGPSENANSSIGIILKANKNLDNALIIEINNEGKYRVKEMTNNSYKYLSKKKNKWLRNKAIKKLNQYNNVEIISKENNIKFLVNEIEIESINYAKNNESYSGILIGPETKARIKYFYINSDKNYVNKIIKTESKIKSSIPLDAKNSTIDSLIDLTNKQKKLIEDLEQKKANEQILNQQKITKIEEENRLIISSKMEKNKENEEKLINSVEKNKSLAFENKNLQQEIERKSEKIDELNKNIETVKKEKENLINKSESLTQKISENSIKIQNLQSKVSSQKKLISSKNSQNLKKINSLEIKEAELNSLITKLKMENEIISSKNKELSILHEKIKTTNRKLSESNSEMLINLGNIKKELKEQEKNNQYLKDLFVYKDFEFNGVKPSNRTSIKQESDLKKTKDSLTYSIQLGVYHFPTPIFNKMKDVYKIFQNNVYTYYYGRYNSLYEVNDAFSKLKLQGHKNIIIVNK